MKRSCPDKPDAPSWAAGASQRVTVSTQRTAPPQTHRRLAPSRWQRRQLV